jgi:hypothetical protein
MPARRKRLLTSKETFVATKLGGLVDADNGLISRRIFIEPEIYAQELERIFARCWLALCHESQIPQSGDCFTTSMGEDPVLVVRDSAGQVHAFLTFCSHRGNRLCRADAGNAATSSLALGLPELPYGSVWLLGAGGGYPRHLSPLAVLRSARRMQ